MGKLIVGLLLLHWLIIVFKWSPFEYCSAINPDNMNAAVSCMESPFWLWRRY
jgi:hypothetical protein